MMYSHVVRRTRIDPDTTSNSTCTYYTTCTYVYAPDPWAVAGSLWQIYFQCMIKPRPKSLLRCNSLENWHSISDWVFGQLSFYPVRNHYHSHCLPIKNNLSQPWPVLACVTLQVSCSEEKEKEKEDHTHNIHHVSLLHRPKTGFPSPHIPDSDLLKKKAPKSYTVIYHRHTYMHIDQRSKTRSHI